MKWLTALFLSPALLCSHTYQLAIGTMFKNEARWVKEWIEYHKIMGVEHFYLYNNDSSDGYLHVLEPYIKSGLVEIIPWESRYAPFHDPRQPVQWVGFQLSAFNDCIQRTCGVAKWLALIDIDEYLFPHYGVESLHTLLKTTDPDVGTLTFKWRCFGTSYFKRLPPHSLMVELLSMRALDSVAENTHHKCIHRPEAVLYTLVHEADLKSGYRVVNIDPRDIRINHYFLRDRESCIEKNRGDVSLLEEKFNSINDTSMSQFIPLLKQAMRKSGSEIR
jgi:hypothetical protein